MHLKTVYFLAGCVALGCGPDFADRPVATGSDTDARGSGTSVATTNANTSAGLVSATTTGDDSTSSSGAGGTAGTCGDSVIDDGEVCDGSDLAGQSCESRGFNAGELACLADCTGYDLSACETALCGNGAVEDAEQCDGAVGDTVCADEGFDNGALACTAECTYDLSGCGICGDTIVDAAEDCDGAGFVDTCVSRGFDSGELACDGSCLFDTTGCGMCGNDIIDGTEVCDGADLGAQTCEGQGLGPGVLACDASCTGFDTSGCAPLYWAAGVQTNVPPATLVGWTECWSGLYGTNTPDRDTILNVDCAGAALLETCRPVGQINYTVLAMADRADVLFDVGNGNVTHAANGVEWYFSDGYSMGFAQGGDVVTRGSCDTTNVNADMRLCWHTGVNEINAGWRCGASTDLNGANDWERKLFVSN